MLVDFLIAIVFTTITFVVLWWKQDEIDEWRKGL